MTPTPTPFITIVRQAGANKRVTERADGSIEKSKGASIYDAVARMVEVPDVKRFLQVLEKIGDDTSAVLLQGYFPGHPPGEDFAVLASSRMNGHESGWLERPGKLRAIARTKENMAASCWQVFDRDVIEGMPERLTKIVTDDDLWFAAMDQLAPGFAQAVSVTIPSNTGRVLLKGEPLPASGRHTWVLLTPESAARLEELGHCLLARSHATGLAFERTWGAHKRPWSIYDPTTFSRERVVYDGAPRTVGKHLAVRSALAPIVRNPDAGAFDITPALDVPESMWKQLHRDHGYRRGRDGSGPCLVQTGDLTPETVIQTQAHGPMTVEQFWRSEHEHVRCQATFRESTSWNGFLSRFHDGTPFLFDNGARVRHDMTDADVSRLRADIWIERLKGMKKAEAQNRWTEHTIGWPAPEQERVRQAMKDVLGIGLRVLAVQLKDAQKRNLALARRAALEERIGARRRMLYQPDYRTEHAREIAKIIAAATPPERWMDHAGSLVRVKLAELPYTHRIDDEDSAPPLVPVFEPYNDTTLLNVVEPLVVLIGERERGGLQAIAFPPSIAEIILANVDEEIGAPKVRGLVAHPVVRPDGSIATQKGLDPRTRLYVWHDLAGEFRPYSRSQARTALAEVKAVLHDGFEFADELSGDVAVAALVTGVVRKLLDMAPAFGFLAAMQSSGKTTLARKIHLLLTGCDMPVMTWPEDAAEARKRITTALMRSPAMLVYDNVMDGFTVRAGPLTPILTAPMFGDRLLGANREVCVPTAVLIVLTGNNLKYGADEAFRFLTARLKVSGKQAHERQFKHPDVVAFTLAHRAQVLQHIIGIVAGYLEPANGERLAEKSRFIAWDRMVRQPILWAGGTDLAEGFNEAIKNSDDIVAHEGVMQALATLFGAQEFTASDVVGKCNPAASFNSALSKQALFLRESLHALRARDTTSLESVGRVLGAIRDRPTGSGMVLRGRVLDGRRVFWVEQPPA